MCDVSIMQRDEALFLNFHRELKDRMRAQVEVLSLYGGSYGRAMGESKEKCLVLLDGFWRELKEQIGLLRQIFLTLERSYMIKNNKHKLIWKLCMHLLGLACNEKPQIMEKLLGSILAMIEKERKARASEESQRVIKSATEMLMELEKYRSPFEDLFIEQTQSFYNEESRREISKNDIKGYIAYIKARVKDEHDRVIAYLDLSTGSRLHTVLENALIKSHIQTLIGPGFTALAEESATAELQTLYEALNKVGEIALLRKSWAEYLHKKGAAMLGMERKSEEIIEDLIKFKESMDNVLKVSFEGDQNFKLSLKNSFEDFLNHNANRSAEYVAKYIDMYLNSDALKKVKQQSDEQIKLTIDRCMPLFRFILNKDIFEAFYLRRLCKRLLFNKLVSTECEKYLLDKLREECGVNYTRKAEAMFQDMEMTQELTRNFDLFLASKVAPAADVQFSAVVLTLGSWPFEAFVPISLPKDVVPPYLLDI